MSVGKKVRCLFKLKGVRGRERKRERGLEGEDWDRDGWVVMLGGEEGWAHRDPEVECQLGPLMCSDTKVQLGKD